MIQKLSNRLLGKDARWHELLFIGLAAGALPGYNDNAEPWLYFLAPGWFFYVFLRVYGLLRVPRNDDLAFVLGIGYGLRRGISQYFILHKCAELALLLLASIVSFVAVRYVVAGLKALSAGAVQASMLGAEVLVFGGLLWGVFRLGLIAPVSHDGTFINRTGSGNKRIRLHRAQIFMSIARSVSLMRNGADRTVLKRQMLYLLRSSIFSTIAVPIIGIVLAAAGMVVLKELSAPVMALAILIAPTFVLSTQIEVMSESASAARACTYNWFTGADLFKANLLLAVLMCVPYLIVYAAYLITIHNEPALLLCTRMLSFAAALAVISLVFGVRWSAPGWKGAPVDAALLAVPCVSFGIAVSYWGWAISLAAAGVILWRRRKE